MVARISLAIVLCALSSRVARADEWASAQIREVFSKSREYFVRVIPGKSIGDTVGFAGAAKGPYAEAEFYRREKDRSYHLASTATLVHPVAPVEFLVTDFGFLITFDNWHNMGYGEVVAFYSPRGNLIRSYKLADLFSAAEIDRFSHSVSSLWWRTQTLYVREGGRSVYAALEPAGREMIFDVASGAYQYCEDQDRKHLCRESNQRRVWRPYREPDTK